MTSADPDSHPGRTDREAGAPRATGAIVARILSEVLAPWVVVLLLPVAVAWQATRAIGPMLLWGLFVALTSSILPMGLIVWGARNGQWEGHHVRNRDGRLVPFLALILSSFGGLAALLLGGAPWMVIALDISMITTLIVTGAITTRWKVSMHTAVAGGAVVILVVTYSAVLWLLGVLLAAIAWSRVRLQDHTHAQVIAGAFAGAIVGGGCYAALV